jgi:fluoroacetyl-CoA thioesterase
MPGPTLPAIPIGTEGTVTVPVTPDLTAHALGNAGVQAYATPMLVLAVERAASAALAPYLTGDLVCLGTHVDVRHLAATPVGFTVKVTCRLVAIEGRRLRFRVEATDDLERVAEGEHERYLGRAADFFDRLARKAQRQPR